LGDRKELYMEHIELYDREVKDLDRELVEELDSEVVDLLPAREELLFNAGAGAGNAAAGFVAANNVFII